MFYFSILLITFSCIRSANKNSSIEGININVGSIKQKWYPNDLIKEKEYLKLQTNKECLISGIDKLIIRNNQIYILDRISNSVFVFNTKGKYIKKYYHYGKGPGELINLHDFDLSKDGKYIYFMDITQRKICKYSINDELIKNVKLDFNTFSFACIDENTLIFYQNKRRNSKRKYQYNLVIWDFKKEDVINGFLPIKEPRPVIIGKSALYYSNRQLYYLPFSASSVYMINKQQLTPFIHILDSAYIEKDFWVNVDPYEVIKKLIASNYSYSFSDFYYTDGIITFSFRKGKKKVKVFYSNANHKSVFGSGFKRENSNRIPGSLNILGVYDDRFISYFTPIRIMRNSHEIYPFYRTQPNLHKELIEIAQKTTVNDNPILVFFKVNIN